MAYIPDVQVGEYETQLMSKIQKVKDMFIDFPSLPTFEVFRSPPDHYRCRCEFAVWHEQESLNYVMYENQPGEKKPQRKNIHQYPVASKVINEMMPVLLEEVRQTEVLRRKLFQVNYHSTLSGEVMVTLLYHKKLAQMEEEWRPLAQKLREKLATCTSAAEVHVIGRSKGAKLMLDRDFVIEKQEIEGRVFSQKQPEGTFSQPNGSMCLHMVSWAVRMARDSPGDCLELYCGNGNFTIPMAKHFRQVVATELSKASTAAARDNCVDNRVDNIFMVRMSSEEFVEAWKTKVKKNRLKDLDMENLQLQTLVVDPPRSGLDEETEKLMLEFDRVLYVSCNPETLHTNLQRVKDTHDIRDFAVFDQFPFTHHLECGVYLVRKPNGDSSPPKKTPRLTSDAT